MSKQFILQNYDYSKIILEGYHKLNDINLPSKNKKFPYNILQIEARPTYKEISLNYIKNRSFYDGGNINDIIEVFFI